MQPVASFLASAASRPVVVGLTGGIGMGKSTASSWMKMAGFRVHDADATVHKLYSPGGAAVNPVCSLIPGVEAADGGVDRAKLSAKLRAGEADLKDVEDLVHPLVAADRSSFLDQATRDGEWLVVLDVPLLLETTDAAARAKLFDALLVVSAPEHVQRARVLGRPGMTQDKLEFVLAKQLPDDVKRAAADFLVDTGPNAMGFDSFAPARASLAKMLVSLADRHATVYERWRDTPRHSSALQNPPSFASPVKGVSFDLDDTLWPTMPPLAAATSSLQAAMLHHMPAAYAAGAAETSALRAQIKAVIDAAPDLAHDFTELRRCALLELAKAHGHAPQCAAAALDAFVRARSDVAQHFYADARPALVALRAAGLRVGACTNGNCDVTLHEDVAQYFDFAVTAAAAGCSKPAPVPFWFAAHGARCRPCELVHIGDDEDTDLKGALAAGCRAILLTRPGPSRPAVDAPPRATAAAGGDKLQADPARWREVASLDEAVVVVLEWQRGAARLREN